MSLLFDYVIRDAAVKLGDPNYSRVTSDDWLLFGNMACRRLSQRLRIVKYLASFDVEADNEMYSLPSDSVQMTRLQYSPTPTDENTFRDVNELPLDLYRAEVNGGYPTGEPVSYCPDAGFLRVTPRPTVTLAMGFRIEYWGLAEAVTLPSSQNFPFQDVMRDLVVDGMMPHALRKLEKVAEADRADAAFEAGIVALEAKVQDRSDDRRTRLRPSRSAAFGQL